MEHRYIALAIFAVSYVIFIFRSDIRTRTAVIAAVLLAATGAVTLPQAFSSVNWNVMGIFIGMLIVSSVFTESGAPAYVAEVLVSRVSSLSVAFLLICVITGFVSMFIDNVSTILIMAPFALSISRRLKIDPTAMMIGMAVSSNLQGAATLIGDPPSMMLGGFMKMNFWDFIIYRGRPSIFFAIEIGALASFAILYLIFLKYRKKISVRVQHRVRSWWPSVLLLALICSLIGTSFMMKDHPYISGSLCLIFALISLLWEMRNNGGTLLGHLAKLDWETSVFLASIFVLVGSMTATGWVERFALFLSGMVGSNIFMAYTAIVFSSVLASAVIDNIPFLATMMPVAIRMSEHLSINPALFLFGLLVGTCLGGNITPIGASANIVACGLLKKEGYPVRFGEFMKIGLPFTMAAVAAGYLFIWFVWR